MVGKTGLLKWLLRVVGSASLLAVFAVAMPYEWMNAIHRTLGMGELPNAPVVGYLARSTSAFYAMHGALFWFLSFDVQRHRSVLLFLGWALAALGVTLLAVDVFEGLPLYWTAVEGPIDTLFGLLILYLAPTREPRPPAPRS